jgi:two-component sensor histidine kinase
MDAPNPHAPQVPLEFGLPRDRTCGAHARRRVESCLAGISDAAMDDVRLVVSELVDNAYLHGRGAIRLRLSRRPARVRVEVIDEGHGASIGIKPARHQGGGHGLRLVDCIAVRWGVLEGSTHVWAELRVF